MRKRRDEILALILTAGLVLSGCGGGRTKDQEEKQGKDGLTTEEITLKVWESSGSTQEFIEKAGEAFTKLHPNIKIEFENVEVGDANTQIVLDGPAGIGPDLFATPSNTIGGLLAGEHILALDDENDVRGVVASSCEKSVTSGGKIYGYPVSDETYALLYNKDLLETPPATWKEVEAFCDSFNGNGKYGIIWNVADEYYSPIFTGMNGNQLFGKDGTDAENTYMNTEDAVAGMKYFQSFRKYLDMPANDLSDNAVALAAFTQGDAAMYITGPWNIASCEAAGMNFGVAPLPELPGDDGPAASFSGARTMQVSAYSEHPKEAQAFGRFLLTEEIQKLRFEITGAIPSVMIDTGSEYIEGFQKQLEYAYPTPSIKEMDNFWNPMKNACSNIWNGADVKTELDNCNQAILSQ